MGETSNRVLPFITIEEAAKQELRYIRGRMSGEIKSLKTPWKKFNQASMDGIEWGSIVTIAGMSGCLSADTIVHIKRAKRTASRRYNLETLYKKFNSGTNKSSNIAWDNKPSYISGYDGKIHAFTRILEVIYSGKKEVWNLKTMNGLSIKATLDHKFLTNKDSIDETSFKKLEDLYVGNFVVTREKSIKSKKIHHYRQSITGEFLKDYPNKRIRVIAGREYYEALLQVFSYDAYTNNLTLEELKNRLINNDIKDLIFKEKDLEIHHLDEDTRNNSKENLVALSKADHAKLHLPNSNMLHKYVEDRIISIEHVGIEDTYDIICEAPIHNFIANNIVTHNSGKTAILNEMETGLFSLNPKENFAVLSFNFEMIARRLVGRKISKDLNITVKQMYNADLENKSTNITAQQYDKAVEYSKTIKDAPVYYVDMPGTVKEIENTIEYFGVHYEPTREKGLLVSLDHSILVKKFGEQNQLETLYELAGMFNSMKKKIKSSYVIISQLNRGIENTDRIQNKNLHYPQKSDVFGADALYQYSDVFMVTHRPEMLNLRAYGPDDLDVKDTIYWHYLKERFSNNDKINYLC
jgi:intein/homing endonuclease